MILYLHKIPTQTLVESNRNANYVNSVKYKEFLTFMAFYNITIRIEEYFIVKD